MNNISISRQIFKRICWICSASISDTKKQLAPLTKVFTGILPAPLAYKQITGASRNTATQKCNFRVLHKRFLTSLTTQPLLRALQTNMLHFGGSSPTQPPCWGTKGSPKSNQNFQKTNQTINSTWKLFQVCFFRQNISLWSRHTRDIYMGLNGNINGFPGIFSYL